MATAWGRCIRRMRFQPCSSPNVFRRNKSLVYVLAIFPLSLLVLLVPGGEIANLKFSEVDDKDGDSSHSLFIASFPASSAARRVGDGSDSVHREPRSVGEDSKRPRLVYLYNAFFESRTWRVQGEAFQDCPLDRCQLTTDPSQLSEADAVLFNARGLPHPQLLPHHPSWQVWILHNSEPPYNIYLDLKLYSNIFNWTSWYRRDADIFSPYGGYVYVNAGTAVAEGRGDSRDRRTNGSLLQVDGLNAHSPTQATAADEAKPSTEHQDLSDVYGLHDKVLYFAASNCQDRGRRYKKVAQLRRYLPIDEYGDCGIIHCPKGSPDCEREFARYQFVLAFENGYCRDYVTEKLWNAYRRLQIPIVSGGADYEKLAIPGSYIDYDNFSSPEELARFVHRVSTTPSLYNSFFQWRQLFQVAETPVADWCGICEALHDEGRPPQVYTDLEGWVAQDSCPLYSHYQFFWTEIYLGIFKLFGV